MLVGLCGAATGAPASVTAAVGAESAESDPAAFVAVTVTWSCMPTSVATGLYVEELAPAIAVHESGVAHRFHAYAYVIGGEPRQVPGRAVSCEPTAGVPVTVGATVLTGLLEPTTAVAAEVAVAEPAEFVAVTASRSVDPVSAPATAYESVVAPVIAWHEAPDALHRCHAYA